MNTQIYGQMTNFTVFQQPVDLPLSQAVDYYITLSLHHYWPTGDDLERQAEPQPPTPDRTSAV